MHVVIVLAVLKFARGRDIVTKSRSVEFRKEVKLQKPVELWLKIVATRESTFRSESSKVVTMPPKTRAGKRKVATEETVPDPPKTPEDSEKSSVPKKRRAAAKNAPKTKAVSEVAPESSRSITKSSNLNTCCASVPSAKMSHLL